MGGMSRAGKDLASVEGEDPLFVCDIVVVDEDGAAGRDHVRIRGL